MLSRHVQKELWFRYLCLSNHQLITILECLKSLVKRTQTYIRFPRHRRLVIPTCITGHAWRMCRYACRDRKLTVSFEVGGGENFPGIPGTCATRNFTYLVRFSVDSSSDLWSHRLENTPGFHFNIKSVFLHIAIPIIKWDDRETTFSLHW